MHALTFAGIAAASKHPKIKFCNSCVEKSDILRIILKVSLTSFSEDFKNKFFLINKS